MGHLVTAAVLLLNLVFYTAYSKEDKTLRFSVLLDVLLLRKGVGHTVNELNKIIALTGLTLAGIAFLPIHLFNSRTNLRVRGNKGHCGSTSLSERGFSCPSSLSLLPT